MQVYCGGCDDFREASEAEVKRLDQGDIRFQCSDCRTVNTNTSAIPRIRG